MTENNPTIITIGFCDWYAIKKIGDKYFLIATKPVFTGYYSLTPCPFFSSKLADFLSTRFISQMSDCFVEIKYLTNISIPTLSQYTNYIENRAPNADYTYLTQTQYPNKEGYMVGIDPNGNQVPVSIVDQCGIRPTMFVDAAYLNTLTNADPIITLFDCTPVIEGHGVTFSDAPTVFSFEPSLVPVQKETVKQEKVIDKPKTQKKPAPIPTPPPRVRTVEKEAEERERESRRRESIAYIYSDFDSDFGIFCDSDNEQLKTIVEQHGYVVNDFSKSSNTSSRNKVNDKTVLDRMGRVSQRWRW